MGVLPPSRLATIEWFEARIADWAANAAAIGLSSAQVTSLTTLLVDARQSYNGAQDARATSKASTTEFHNNTDAMRDYGADLIKTIKAFAEATDDPNVYAVAQVPMPADPVPMGPPGQPTDVTKTLTAEGALKLTWKATDAAPSSGASFVISRRLDSETGFAIVGATGVKSFTDDTLPLGVSIATYIVTPQRGDMIGTSSEQITVQFGVGGSGGGQLSLAA